MFRMQRDDTFLRLMLGCIQQLMVMLAQYPSGITALANVHSAEMHPARHVCSWCELCLITTVASVQVQFVLPGLAPPANCFATSPQHQQLFSR